MLGGSSVCGASCKESSGWYSRSVKRIAPLPETATVAESGLPGYEASVWYGVAAPARTPVEVVNRLNAEIVAAIGLALIATVNQFSTAVVSLYQSLTTGLGSIGAGGQ